MPSHRKSSQSRSRSTRRENPGKRAPAKRERSPETPASIARPGEMMRETGKMISDSANTLRGLQRETGKEMANALDLTKTASLAPFQVASAWSKVWQVWMRSVAGM